MTEKTRRPSAPIITRERAVLLSGHCREMADIKGVERDFKRAASEQVDAQRYDSIVEWFDSQQSGLDLLNAGISDPDGYVDLGPDAGQDPEAAVESE